MDIKEIAERAKVSTATVSRTIPASQRLLCGRALALPMAETPHTCKPSSRHETERLKVVLFGRQVYPCLLVSQWHNISTKL